MLGSKTYHGDCVILPINGRAFITTTAIPPLRLPNEHLHNHQSWKPLVIAIFSLFLWLTPTPTQAAVTPVEILSATNAERVANGLAPLTADSRLDAAATAKANDIFAQQYFSHLSPDGLRGWHWMKAAGYSYTEAGENLAMDFLNSEDVVTAWMGSSGHRQNMISTKYVDAGIAAISGTFKGKATTVIVMLFGRQTSPTATTVSATAIPAQPVAPVTTNPAPPTPRIEALSIPMVPTATLIPSIVEPVGQLAPTLTFTLQVPNPKYFTPMEPRVLGSTVANPTRMVDQETSAAIATAILASLVITGGMLGLASRWWMSIYPQPEPRSVSVQV